MKERINWIDWAKAIGITLVVLGHFKYTGDDAVYRYFIYSFHMPLFFFLSGFLYKKPQDLEASVKKDFRGLIIPYILLNIIAYILLIPYYIHHGVGLLKPIGDIVTISGHAPAGACWFLVSLFIIKFVMYFVFQKPVKTQIIFILLVSVFTYCISLFVPEINTFRVGTTCMAFLFFFIGFYTKKIDILSLLKSKYLAFFIFAILFVLLIFTSKYNGRVDMYACDYGKNPLLFHFNAIIGIAMTLALCISLNQIGLKFIKTIASGTILIMALHLNKPFILYKIIELFGINIHPTIVTNIVASIVIIMLFYYPILFVQRYMPVLIGNRK